MLRGKPSNRGQVLIIFVFAIIGLVGITGLAVDGGNVYQDRRQAQNAADAAALSAALTRNAWEKANGSCNNFNTETHTLPSCATTALTGWTTIIDAALNAARTNGYSGDLVSSTVNVYNPPKDGTYSNCGQSSFSCYDYVEVIINSNVDTYFARVLGIGQLHNTVEAVALSKYRASGPLYGGDALVILAPHAVNGSSGEFGTKGSASVYVHGGDIFVNSDGDNAFVEASCIIFQMDAGHSVNVVGKANLPGGCPTTPPVQKATATQFPPDDPFTTEPAECGIAGHSTIDTTGTYSGWTHLYPGYYSTAGSNKFPPGTNTYLDPGVYCIDGLVKTTNPNTQLVGYNVFLYIRKGGSFNFGGGTAQLTAMTTGKYAGYLIYATPDYSLVSGSVPSCTIDAGSSDVFTGVIYASNCNVTINGGSASVGLKAKLIAYTLLLNGSNTLTFYYDDSSNPSVPEVDTTGLFH